MQTAIKYQIIHDELKAEILDGKYRPGDTFPSEPELQTRFDASRVTIRRSVQMLVDEGFLKRMQGVGTVVISDKQTLQLKNLVSFADEHKSRKTSSVVVMSDPAMEASPLVCSQLNITPGSKVACQEKVRVGEGVPLGFQRVYVPSTIGLTDKELSLPEVSLYESLSAKGHAVYKAEETIEAALCDDRLADLLKIQSGTPLLYVQRITEDRIGTRVEYAEIYYRGDQYHYRIQLQAPDADAVPEG